MHGWIFHFCNLSLMSLAPASQTIRIIHCILEWVNLIFTGLKNEKFKSVEAFKSAKSVLIFLPEFASRLGIVELFTRKLFPSLRSLRCPLLSKLSILFVVLSTFDLDPSKKLVDGVSTT